MQDDEEKAEPRLPVFVDGCGEILLLLSSPSTAQLYLALASWSRVLLCAYVRRGRKKSQMIFNRPWCRSQGKLKVKGQGERNYKAKFISLRLSIPEDTYHNLSLHLHYRSELCLLYP